MTKIILTNKAYVPADLVDMDKVEERFSAPIFDDMSCRTCYYQSQRPCNACTTCPAFDGWLHLWKPIKVKGVDHVGIPLANWRNSLTKLGVNLDDMDIDDLRPKIPFVTGLKFTGELFDERTPDRTNQVNIVDEFMRETKDRDYCGVILALPRSGKSAMSLYIAIEELKMRTLITCSQIDWLEQFCTDLGFLTNMSELARRGKTPVVLISSKASSKKLEKIGVKVVKSWKQVPKESDIVLCTYLQMKPGKDDTPGKPSAILREFVLGKFTTLVVDEAHQGAARVMGAILNNLDTTHRVALTATPDRKDGQSFIVYKVLGPVSSVTDTPTMVPIFKLLQTNIQNAPETINGPAAYETWLAYNEDRNKVILKQLFKDLEEDDDHCVLLPVRRVQHARELVKKINQTAAYKNHKEGANWPIPLATIFTGQQDRAQALEDARNFKVRVVVAIEKIVKHGISVAPWSHIYTGISPISNGSMFFQLYSRVCTPYPKEWKSEKPQPIVRHMVDATSSSVKTLGNLYTSEYDSLKDALHKEPKRLKMAREERDRMMYIIGRPFAYFGSEKQDQLNRRRNSRIVGGFGGSKRTKDTR